MKTLTRTVGYTAAAVAGTALSGVLTAGMVLLFQLAQSL